MRIKVLLSLLIIVHFIFYGCIYVSFITFSFLDMVGLNPEYQDRQIVGSKYGHAYVHYNGYNLFLNPLGEYGEIRFHSTSTLEHFQRYGNTGKIYIPFLNPFVSLK